MACETVTLFKFSIYEISHKKVFIYATTYGETILLLCLQTFVQNKVRLLFHIYFFSYAVLTISRIVTYNSVFYLNHFLINNFFFAHNFYTTTKQELTTDSACGPLNTIYPARKVGERTKSQQALNKQCWHSWATP